MEQQSFVYSGDDGKRADVFVSEALDVTRNFAEGLFSGSVLLNGKLCKKNCRLKTGDTVSVTLPDPTPLDVTAEDIPLDIVYEDEHLLVVNKPKGMVVHPAAGNYSGTLVNALLHHCGSSLSGINGVMRPGILHRIDKDTSGLLLVAKNDFAHNFLARQIKEHSLTREYQAVAYGGFKNDDGTVDAPIGRHKIKRKQMAVTPENSKNAVTHYKVIKRYNGFTHIACRLETGRTHQIRVHMSYIGHPLAGDSVYGPAKIIKELSGQCLHAGKIGFIHPKTNEYMEFTAELPQYFKKFLSGLKEL